MYQFCCSFQSLLYIDEIVLQDLTPLLQELLTANIGLPTKVASSHFISLLITQKQHQLNSKFLGKIYILKLMYFFQYSILYVFIFR